MRSIGKKTEQEIIQEEVIDTLRILLEAEGDNEDTNPIPNPDDEEIDLDDDDDNRDKKEENDYSNLDDDFVERIGVKTIEQIEDELGEIYDVSESPFGHGWTIEIGRMEYYVFADYDDAEREARDVVEQYLEQEPEIFNQDWLQSHIYITDTDRRLKAQDDGNAMRSDGVFDKQFDDEFGMVDRDDVIDELGEYLSYEEKANYKAKYQEYDDLFHEESEEDMERRNNIGDELDELVDTLKESARDSYVDEKESEYIDKVEEALNDPIQYFVHDQGTYSMEDLMNASFIYIDIEDAAKDAVSEDGVAHFLAGYDDEEIEIGDAYLYRNN